MKKVLLVTLVMFVGHIVYGVFFSDQGLAWSSIFERTWFQFGALIAFHWVGEAL